MRRNAMAFCIAVSAALFASCSPDDAGRDSSTVVAADPVTIVPDAVEESEPCRTALELVATDIDLAAAEPFAFVMRDPLAVRLRTLIGEVRLKAWTYDKDLYDLLFQSTMRLQSADFSESGLLTNDEAAAAMALSTVLEGTCGVPLSPDGLLIASPSS